MLRQSQKARPGPTGPEEVCAEIVVSAIGRDLGAGRETRKRAQTAILGRLITHEWGGGKGGFQRAERSLGDGGPFGYWMAFDDYLIIFFA